MYEQEQAIRAEAVGRANAGQVDSKPSPTFQRINHLREAQNDVHDEISILEKALSSILGPPPPEAGGKTEKLNPSAPSALCEELEGRIASAYSAKARLRDLVSRITV